MNGRAEQEAVIRTIMGLSFFLLILCTILRHQSIQLGDFSKNKFVFSTIETLIENIIFQNCKPRTICCETDEMAKDIPSGKAFAFSDAGQLRCAHSYGVEIPGRIFIYIFYGK